MKRKLFAMVTALVLLLNQIPFGVLATEDPTAAPTETTTEPVTETTTVPTAETTAPPTETDAPTEPVCDSSEDCQAQSHEADCRKVAKATLTAMIAALPSPETVAAMDASQREAFHTNSLLPIQTFANQYGFNIDSDPTLAAINEALNSTLPISEPACATVTIGDGAASDAMPLAEALAEALKATAGSTVVVTLTDNVDLTNWTAVNFNKNLIFTLDGNGKTISNLSACLFSDVNAPGLESVTIKNLTITNVNISTGTNYAGALIGNNEDHDGADYLEINNVHVSGGSITSNKYTGGLIGYSSTTGTINIVDSSVKGVEITGASVAGLIGHAHPVNCTITKCEVGGNTIINTSNEPQKVGSVIGTSNCATYIDVTETEKSTGYCGETPATLNVIGRVYAVVAITGGQYYTNPTVASYEDTNAKFTHDGQVAQGTDGMYGIKLVKIGSVYYDTLADAVAAASSGDTITLLGNITRGSAVTIDKNLTIDLGTYTYTAYPDTDSSATVSPGITVTANGSLALKGSGTLELDSHSKADYALSLANNLTLGDQVKVTGPIEVSGTAILSLNSANTSVDKIYVAEAAALEISDTSTGSIGSIILTGEFLNVQKPASMTINLPEGYTWTNNTMLDTVKYGITYKDGTEDISGLTPTTYTVEEKIELPTPTKTGYTFGGWYTEEALTNQVTEIPKGSTENKTFYAKWEIIDYKLTYELNGGTLADGVTNPTTYTVETATITLPTPTARAYYTFEGWYETADFSSSKVTEIAKGSTGDKTLYAKWQGQQFTITYMLNGGTLPNYAPTTHTYGTDTFVPSPTKDHYWFSNWYADAALTQEVDARLNGDAYTANITLYAKWVPETFSITYMDGETKLNNLSPAQYDIDSSTFALPTPPAKAHYTFDGWYDNADLTGEAVTQIVGGTTGKRTFYAKYTAEQYNITYELDGGTPGTNAPGQHTYGTETTLVAPSKTGHVFDGWYTNENLTNKVDSLSATGYTADIKLYAKWTVNTYTITYYKDSSTPHANYVLNYGATVTVPANPTKEGYTFAGWDATIPTTMPAQDLIIRATWTPNTYTVKFDANGGSGTMADQAFTYGTTQKLTANAFTHSDSRMVFEGWSTAKDGAKAYDNGAEVSNLTAADKGTVTLYAVWTQKQEWTAPTLAYKTVTYTGKAAAYPIEGFQVTFQQSGVPVTPILPGSYDVVIEKAADDTHVAYHYVFQNGLTITKAKLTATYAGETVAYGAAPKLSVTVTGFVGGESAATAAGYQAPTVKNVPTAAGQHQLTPSDGKADNYTFDYVPGYLKIQYIITQGAEQSVYRSSRADFTSNAPYSLFRWVEVDGKEVSSWYYTKAEGSTKISLSSAFISTLATGDHTLTIVSADGSASTTFTVKATSVNDNPSTGDKILTQLQLSLALTSALAILAAFLGKKLYRKQR